MVQDVQNFRKLKQNTYPNKPDTEKVNLRQKKKKTPTRQ